MTICRLALRWRQIAGDETEIGQHLPDAHRQFVAGRCWRLRHPAQLAEDHLPARRRAERRRRPTGLTLMLRLHFRQRTVLGRGGRSEKSMRLPVVCEIVDEKDNVTIGPGLPHLVVAARDVTLTQWCVWQGSSPIQGSLMAGFTAWPARPCAGGAGPVVGWPVARGALCAPDPSARTTPGRLTVSPVAHDLADRQVPVLSAQGSCARWRLSQLHRSDCLRCA